MSCCIQSDLSIKCDPNTWVESRAGNKFVSIEKNGLSHFWDSPLRKFLHIENMDYIFQSPQGGTVYTDNPKLRGVLMLSPRNIILVKRAHLGFTSIVSHKI